MILRWIFGVLLVLTVLLCLLRIGVQVGYDEILSVRVSAGPFRFQIVPSKKPKKAKEPKKKKKLKKSKKKPKKEQNPEEEVPEEKKKSAFPKPDLTDIRSAVSTLWPPLKKALGRVRRGIRIDPLEVSATLGGADDPAASAEICGYANAAVWTAMPMLEQLLDIPRPHIRLETDFQQEQTRCKALIGVTARVGTLLAAGLRVGIPAIKWYLHFLKRHKQAEAAPPQTEPAEKRPAA